MLLRDFAFDVMHETLQKWVVYVFLFGQVYTCDAFLTVIAAHLLPRRFASSISLNLSSRPNRFAMVGFSSSGFTVFVY